MDSEKMVIYFDMDGVLADMNGYLKKHNIPHNSLNETNEETDIIMWDQIREIPHFYDKLEPLEGSVELFKKLSAKYDCRILTAQPKPKWNIPDAKEDKIAWAKRYLGQDVKILVVLREEKKDYTQGPHTVLIDDYPWNIEAWEEQGGTGILFTDAASFDYDRLDEIASKYKDVGFFFEKET